MKAAMLMIIATAMFASCDRPARFRIGDKVKVKLTDTTGVIAARNRLSGDDAYFLNVPGKRSALDKRESFFLWYATADEANWHTEGPYYDTELQVSP